MFDMIMKKGCMLMNGYLLLQIAASIVPTQTALIDSEKQWTYDELLREGMRVAGSLKPHVTTGDTVAIVLTNRVEYIAVLLACWQLGVVAMPMNTRLKEGERDALLADVACVVTESRYAEQSFRVPVVFVESIEQAYDGVHECEQALTLLTSGTSSAPKKVEIFHEQFAGYIFEHNDAPDGSDRGVYLNVVPLFHISGLTAVFHALYSGRAVVLQEGFHAEQFVNAVEQHRVTHTLVVPTMLYDILQQQAKLPTLQQLTYGGAPMPMPILARALQQLPHVAFSNAYGLTETTATITALTADDHRQTDEVGRRRLRSVGRAIDGVHIRIRRDGQTCAPYEVGVVEVQSARINRYAGHDAPTWFVTHDEGYVDEGGYLFLTGRSSDVIVRGGENIAAHEVEQALLREPSIVQAAVVGVEHERWGEEVAALVVANGVVDAEQLRASLKTKLATFKVPTRFIFVKKLPVSTTGKVDKRQIIRIFNEQKGNSVQHGE